MTRFRLMLMLSVGALGILAANAAGASAAMFHAERATAKAPAILAGGQKTPHKFKIDAGEVECKKASFPGTATETTQSSITVFPEYGECKAFFGLASATVTMNGCGYEFHEPGGPPYSGTVSIVCPPGNEIVVNAAGVCTATVKGVGTEATPHNENLSTVSYENLGSLSSRTILVTANVSGIEYSQSGTLCATEINQTNGTYKGSTEESSTQGGNPNGIWVE